MLVWTLNELLTKRCSVLGATRMTSSKRVILFSRSLFFFVIVAQTIAAPLLL